MANVLPALRVLENNLPTAHPGSAFAAGHVLAPRDAEGDADPELAALYAPLTDRGSGLRGGTDPALDDDGALGRDNPLPNVRANFITTLDGSVIGADGKSGSINGPADLRVFQLLRAQSDAVFVGAGTARTEGYQDTDIPAGLEDLRADGNPKMVTVTRSGDLAPEFLDTAPLIITANGHPAAQKLRGAVPSENLLIFGTNAVDFPAALRELGARGYENVLCEGGPHLMGSLISHGLVSELCLSFSPMIVGGSGYRFMVGRLSETSAQLRVLLSSADGYLMSRWTVRSVGD